MRCSFRLGRPIRQSVTSSGEARQKLFGHTICLLISFRLVICPRRLQSLGAFENPRGKYVCLLYVLSAPLNPEAWIEAGDDASRVQWYSVENIQSLPSLAFNHIRLLRMALRQFFTSYYHDAVGMQEIATCQCERKISPGVRCLNTAYWSYEGTAICPRDMQ